MLFQGKARRILDTTTVSERENKPTMVLSSEGEGGDFCGSVGSLESRMCCLETP